MNSFYFLLRPFRIFILSSLALSLLFSVLADDAQVFDLSKYMPVGKDNYWSFIGEIRTDDMDSRINLRREIDGAVSLNNRMTFRETQEVIPSLSDALDQISFLDKKEYLTSDNGWRIFREEYSGSVLQYKWPAKVLPLLAEQDKYSKYKTTLDPESGTPGVVSYHTVVVGLETLEIPNGTMEALKINQEKKTKIATDESLDDISSLITEYSSYWLVEGVGVAKQETTITTVDDSGSESIDLSYELVATNYLPNYLWPEAETTPEGWKHVDWLGDITDNYFPWIYHADHGWMFVDAEDTSEVKLWSESLGWWLTSKDLYPTFYSLDLNDWLTFQENDSVEREFVRSDGSIVRASTAGFTYRPQTSRPEATAISSQTEREGDQTFYDAYGNRYVDSSGGITANQGESPMVEFISPFEGTILDEGEPVLLFVDAQDKDGKVEYVRFYVNGMLVLIDEEAPYQTIYTPADGDEVLNVYAIAKDNDGNETQTDTVVVDINVSKYPPKVRIDSPLNKTVFKSGTKITVEVVASDSDGFISSVALMIDGIQVGSEITSPPYRFSFIPPVDGSYQISAVAIDDDLNETTSTSISITVNETGRPASEESYSPEVRVVAPLNKTQIDLGDSIDIEAVASDEDGDVDRVQIFVDGVQVGSNLYNSPYEVSYKPPAKGTYSITAKARDNDRNESTSVAVQLTVD